MTVPAQPGLEASIGSLTQTTNTTNGAQSPVPSPSAFQHGATNERTYSSDEYMAALAKVRQEEKDKLYADMKSMKDSLKAIEDQRASELAAIEAEKQQKLDAQKAKKEEEMSAKALFEQKLTETNANWEERFNAIQAERDLERAQAAKERAYNELVDYRNSQLQENINDIAPQLRDFVTGETREQIDSAIARAKAATQSIADEVQTARQQQMSQMRGVSPTGYAPVGPMDTLGSQKPATPEEIALMPMAEYAVWRQKNGIASRSEANNRGILG